ncbi:MAG: GNAT family N-acetyltransferase [Hydrogenophaga sp.]|nr:GNAT family N-acetyltransferase [Hydrogenophaga sp.]
MKIRLAQASDEAVLLQMARAMHAESRFAHFPLQEEQLRTLIAETLKDPKGRCILLAESAAAGVVGMLGGYVLPLFFTQAFIAQDQFFYVLAPHRGSSAAAKLLLAFERWAVNRQVHEININMSVAIDMERFDRFMTHAGYRTCGQNYFKPTRQRAAV